MEVRTYPLLRPPILCDLIKKGWGISVTEQDLREPKPETVQNIYAAVLGDLLSLDLVGSFEKDGQLAIGDIESPEYYYESTRMQMLLYHMARVAKICKVQTFTIRDLTRPTGPRTIRVLSAVCNFRAFSDVAERQNFLRDLQTQAENKQQRLDERAAELQDVEEELASIQISLEQDKPELARVKDNIERLKEQMKEDLGVVDENLKHVQDLKTEKRELKAKIEDLTREIQDVNRSNINDKGRIMQSPDRVKRKIQDMAASSDALKPLITQAEGVRTQLQAKDNALRGFIQDLKEVVRDLENLKADLRALGTVKDQYAERYALQTQRQAHYKILTTQLTQADRQRLRAEEKLQELRISHQQKQESARRKHEVLQERYRKLVALRGERDLDDSHQKEAMELVVKEQDVFIGEQQADIDSLFDEYNNIEDVIYSYMKDLDKNLNLKMYKNQSKRGAGDAKHSSKRRKKSKSARATSADPPATNL